MDRQRLSQLLKDMIAPYVNDNKEHVFFQSPGTYMLSYPSIIYKFENYERIFANNCPYRLMPKWSIQLITRNPDLPLIEELAKLPYSSLDKPFVSDNLYHYNYTIYF